MEIDSLNGRWYDSAIESVDRKCFIKNSQQELVVGRSIPSKEFLERILSICKLPPNAQVLHLGAGIGYASAVLGHVAAHVTGVEKSSILARLAREKMAELHLHNVKIIEGDARQRVAKDGPFDLILVSSPTISKRENFWEQLAIGGQCICMELGDASRMVLVKYENLGHHKIVRTEHGYVNFVEKEDHIYVQLSQLTPALLTDARNQAKANNTLIVDEISKSQRLDELKLYRSLAKQYGLPLMKLEELLPRVDPSIFLRFSRAFLDYKQVIPICIEAGNLQVVCTTPSTSMAGIHLVFPKLKVEKVLVTPVDFRRLWSALSRGSRGSEEGQVTPDEGALNGLDEDKDLLSGDDGFDRDTRVVAVYEALLLDAVADRASDIHLEKYHDRIRVRLRVDGELRDLHHYQISASDYRGLVNVAKLRSEMNIAEHRLPQGGRSQVRVGDARFDLRVQVQPSLHGEHVVIRLLAQNSPLISIDSLGMAPMVASHYRRLLNNPAGLVLVVGPTGSGKSTTLNAGLQLLAKDVSRKVITVEDPIEFSIDDIQQTRVRPEIDFKFSDAMRSFVRQDPDVILVGEIRDHETALEAIRASQTGHVVLSTLHCNDAIDAVQRLFDLNVHPNSLASELLAVIAQRLAKRICDHCKVAVDPEPEILRELFPHDVPANFKAFRGSGCAHCNGKGTRGRVAVIEYLQLNTELRDSISRRNPVGELRAQALDSGLITMRDSALDHVIQGNIPLTELPRILPEERMAPEKRGQWQA